MKNILLTSAILALSLFSHPGTTADLAIPASDPASQHAALPAAQHAALAVSLPVSLSVSDAPAQMADMATEVQFGPSPSRQTPVQLAAVGELRDRTGSGSLQDADLSAMRLATGGLPSTPVALASLLLMICILVGRRNG